MTQTHSLAYRHHGEADAEFVTLADAGARYSLSTRTLRRAIADGRLPAFRLGRLVRIRATDLEQLFRPIPTA